MYITINSEFKPFTYDELTKPLHDYTEAYNKVEEQYATLAQQTEAWKNIATQENSPEAYAMYKKYSDELNAVVEDFSRGMTVQNRSKLTGLKSRYASEITPIANAYAAMQAANEYRDTVKGQDDTAVFNVDRYDSLDQFLNGQVADNSFISGKGLQDNIAKQTMAASYDKYNQLLAQGHSKRAAATIVAKGDWIKEDSILNDVYNSTGINTEEAASKLKSYTDNGIIQGISTFSINVDSSIVEEELTRYRYRDDNTQPTSSNNDSNLLKAYRLLGMPISEERTKTSSTIKNEGTPYESTETSSSTYTVDFTIEQILTRASNDEDVIFTTELLDAEIPEEVILQYYNDYKKIKDVTLFSNIRTFEDYINNEMTSYYE